MALAARSDDGAQSTATPPTIGTRDKYLEEKASSRGAKQHYVSNQLIEIDGDDAVSEAYYLC